MQRTGNPFTRAAGLPQRLMPQQPYAEKQNGTDPLADKKNADEAANEKAS